MQTQDQKRLGPEGNAGQAKAVIEQIERENGDETGSTYFDLPRFTRNFFFDLFLTTCHDMLSFPSL